MELCRNMKPSHMHVDPLRHEDLDDFLLIAASEGWICDRWEFDFLLAVFPAGCLVARLDGEAVAFVTSVKYADSGWVGNLIVRRDLRRTGIGSLLLKEVLAILAGAGTRTVWLTASEQGRPLSERLGFVACDAIKRWHGWGSAGECRRPAPVPLTKIVELDRAGWGDRRETLLAATAGRGWVEGDDHGFLVVQPHADGMQIGPWGGIGQQGAAALLDGALTRTGRGKRVFLDAPAGNVKGAALLHGRGFTICGSTVLMYLGEKPAYSPGFVFALASMGGMG
jgi:GNAT superfamily N-acetyltransferase